jgi:hypothetical protein
MQFKQNYKRVKIAASVVRVSDVSYPLYIFIKRHNEKNNI